MTPSKRLVARMQIARRSAAKSNGPDIRAKLNNARIALNNIQSKYGRGSKGADLQAAVKDLEEVIQTVTSVVFGISNDEAKTHLIKSVLSEVNQAITAAQAGDQRGIEIGAGRASTFLDGAIEHLEKNPDAAEQKEILSRYLIQLVPRYGDNETIYQRAINLCKQLAEGEKAKAKDFFTELAKALEGSLEAQMDLSSAAANAYKMLPKAR